MDHRLFITLELHDDCMLVPVDHTAYDHWGSDNANHGVIEFVTTINDDMVTQKFRVINFRGRDYAALNHCTPLNLEKDGIYIYHKLIVPSLSHFAVDEHGHRVVESDATQYAVANKYFVYKGDIYFSNQDCDANKIDTSKFEIVKDIRDVWDGRKEINEMFWYDGIIVSICHLTKCLYNLQRKILIDNYGDFCLSSNNCSSNNSLKKQRDFILDAVMVLKFLIRKKLYSEAQEILDQLNSCGNTICNELSDKFLKGGDCGCGKVV